MTRKNKNILFVSYMFLDSHLCKQSRFSILKSLSKKGNKTFLYAAHINKKNIVKTNIFHQTSISLPGIQLINFITYQVKSFFIIPKIIFNNNIDVVICDINSTPSIIPLLILKKFKLIKTTFILDFRSNILHSRKNVIQNILKGIYLRIMINISFFLYEKFTFITFSFKSHIEKKFNITYKNFTVWSSGVDKKFLTKTEKIENQKFTIIHHGSLEKGRGIMRLIESMSLLNKELNNKVVLKIAGVGSLDKKISELSKNSKYKLKFYGEINHADIIAFIDMGDIGIVPFDNSIANKTSSPLKVVEYVARNRTILATKLKNFENNFSNYSSIYYMNNNSSKDIARAIENIINNYDNIKKNNLGDGQMLIRKKYTWDAQAKKIIKFINE